MKWPHILLILLLVSCNSSKRIVDKQRQAIDIDIKTKIDSLVKSKLVEVDKWAKLNLNVTPDSTGKFEIEFTEKGFKGTGIKKVGIINEESIKKTEQTRDIDLFRSKQENMKTSTNIKQTERKSNRLPISLIIGIVFIILFALYFRRNILYLFNRKGLQ